MYLYVINYYIDKLYIKNKAKTVIGDCVIILFQQVSPSHNNTTQLSPNKTRKSNPDIL